MMIGITRLKPKGRCSTIENLITANKYSLSTKHLSKYRMLLLESDQETKVAIAYSTKILGFTLISPLRCVVLSSEF